MQDFPNANQLSGRAIGAIFFACFGTVWLFLAITAKQLIGLATVTAIIGLHLFPLVRLFHYPLHYATGTVLVVWAAATAMLIPLDQMQGTAALGTGIILWLSAIVTLSIGIKAAHRAAELFPS